MKRALLLVVLLAACGKQGELMPKAPPGVTPVVDPAKPTPSKLLVVPTQGRPERADDPLIKSEERRVDRFDLPPKR